MNRSAQAHQIVPDTSRELPQGDDYYHRLLSLIKLVPLPLAKAKTDPRREELLFVDPSPEGTPLPPPLLDLVDFARSRCEVVQAIGYQVRLGCYMRKAGMQLPPPPKNTVNRILFNFGNEELFKLDPRVPQVDNLIGELISEKTKIKMDTGLPERNIFLLPNRFLELGTITSANYAINVRKDVNFTRPDRYEGRQLVKGQPTMRPSNYRRVMVVIDFITDGTAIQEISDKAREVSKNISVERVQELLKQQKVEDRKMNENRLHKKEEEEVDQAMINLKQKINDGTTSNVS